MPREQHVPVELTRRPFRGSEARARGLITRHQLSSPAWRRMLQDVYVHAAIPDSMELRISAAGLCVPPGSVVCGTTAAWLHGADVLQDTAVEVAVPPGVRLRSRAELKVHRLRLNAEDVTTVCGLAVTTPLRTAFDVARRSRPHGDPTEALVVADALSHRALFTPEELSDYARRPRFAGRRGARLVPALARDIEPRTESPGETRIRMRLVHAGLPRPSAQVEVFDAYGNFIARLDLAYEEVKLAVEYDGKWHAQRWDTDLARGNKLRTEGWELLTFTYRDLRTDTIAAQVREVLRRRGG